MLSVTHNKQQTWQRITERPWSGKFVVSWSSAHDILVRVPAHIFVQKLPYRVGLCLNSAIAPRIQVCIPQKLVRWSCSCCRGHRLRTECIQNHNSLHVYSMHSNASQFSCVKMVPCTHQEKVTTYHSQPLQLHPYASSLGQDSPGSRFICWSHVKVAPSRQPSLLWQIATRQTYSNRHCTIIWIGFGQCNANYKPDTQAEMQRRQTHIFAIDSRNVVAIIQILNFGRRKLCCALLECAPSTSSRHCTLWVLKAHASGYSWKLARNQNFNPACMSMHGVVSSSWAELKVLQNHLLFCDMFSTSFSFSQIYCVFNGYR